MNHTEEFKDTIRSHGLIPPSVFALGKIQRIDCADRRKGNKDGWCILFDDCMGGVCGNWPSGFSETWQARREKPFTQEEGQEFARRVEESRRQAEAARKQKADKAAKQSVLIWKNAKPCTTHTYCEKKQIEPNPARELSSLSDECKGWFWTTDNDGLVELEGNLLLLPLYNINGELRGLQGIDAEGRKSLIKGLSKKGLFIPITGGKLPADYAGKIYIGEGFSTTKTVKQATNDPSIAAIDANNLLHVAQDWRSKCPQAEIIIAGDIDKSGAGERKANSAALAIDGLVALPSFTEEELSIDPPPSDFNDYAALHGLGAVGRALTKANTPSDTKDTPESDNALHYETAIKELAKLKPFEYDRVREDRAKALGVRQPTLDADVKTARQESKQDDSPFTDIEPYSESIDPAQLLDDITDTILRFIVLDKYQAQLAALWVSACWFVDVIHTSPIALINAPERACGKTLFLTLLGKLAPRPAQASGISPSVLFRMIEAYQPTLFIDEIETVLKDNDDLRGLINAGHTRDSAYVWRSVSVGDDFEPKRFKVWGMKAICGINAIKLAETVTSRSIIFELRRKKKDEPVQRLRQAEPDLFSTLSAKLARFADDCSTNVRDAHPILPEALSDREQDNFEPLLAIAGVAGGHWPDTAFKAALKLSGATLTTQSTASELLADIQKVSEEKELDKISTNDLIDALISDKEKSWATYNRGNPISPRQVSNRLAGYGIKSKTVRTVNGIVKGFEVLQFEDVFSRYLATPPNKRLQGNNSLKANNGTDLGVTFTENHKVTQTQKVTPKPAPALDCNVVTFSEPISRGEEKEFPKSTHLRI